MTIMYRSAVVTLLLAASASLLSVQAAAISPEADIYQWSGDWRDEHGVAAPLASWSGQTVLLTMAYSNCREVCSYTLQRLQVEQQSAERRGEHVNVIVI